MPRPLLEKIGYMYNLYLASHHEKIRSESCDALTQVLLPEI